jgi:hypothetical protein
MTAERSFGLASVSGSTGKPASSFSGREIASRGVSPAFKLRSFYFKAFYFQPVRMVPFGSKMSLCVPSGTVK